MSVARASEWLQASMRAESPRPDGQFRAGGPPVQRLGDYLRGETRNTLLTLFAAAWALVLLSCVGVINLLLARSADREAEVAVQLALGASRARLVRQRLLETSVLVAIGAFVGLWLSYLGRRWLRAQLPDLAIGWPITPVSMGVIVGLIAIVTLLSGLTPALYATRRSTASLVAATSATVSPRRRLSLIELLAAAQLALAVCLLSSAVLLGRSLYLQVNTPLGFTPENVLSFRTALAPSPERLAIDAKFESSRPTTTKALHEWARARTLAAKPQIAAEYQRAREFLRQLTERLTALPGVTAVDVLSPTPFSEQAVRFGRGFPYSVSSQAGPKTRDRGEKIQAVNAYVTENALEALGGRFLAGRPFTAAEIDDAFRALHSRIGAASTPHPPYPAIVNQSLARRVWGTANPVGQYFNTSDHEQSFQVVGVVGDFQWTPGVAIDRPVVFHPFEGARLAADVVVKVRPEVEISGLRRDIDTIVIALAPDAAHVQVHRLDDMVRAAQHDLRIVLTLLGCFAVVGIVVASLGIFTVASLMIRSRTRELGIRLALGATPRGIRRTLLLRIAVTMIGLPAGWFLGWLLVRQLSHYLTNVTASDVTGYALSSVVAGLAVLAALSAPLMRAGRIDPVAVLRHD
jgi:putative ABC transport system permease protein